ncbi:MAG: alanyl-tRNA editing protein [Thermoplasmata archaeon]
MTEIIYMADIDGNYVKEFEATVERTGDDHVVLDRTAFYPEGGGQPSDRGVLKWNGNETQVIKVEKKGDIIHRVKGPIPEEGTTVKAKIDWDLRYEHMKMHTVQHLLSAAVFEMYGGETVGNQIHADYSRVDFAPVNLSDEDVQKIQDEVNRVIDEGLDVSIYEEDRDKLEEEMDEKRVNLSLLPRSIKRLRVIDIDGCDICPCAGTHLRNTKEIGSIEITKVENKGKDRQRIYYELK